MILGAAAVMAATAIMPFSAGAAKTDSRFTLTDLVIVSQYLAGKRELTEQQTEAFDLTGDGDVTLSDLVQMARDFSQETPAEPTGSHTPVAPTASATPATATAAPTAAPLTQEQIQQLALDRVPGATAANIVSIKPDTELGTKVYDVELRYGGVEYELTYSLSGSLLKEEVDWPVDPSYEGGQQTEQSARELAVSQVPGAADGDITSCKLDTEEDVRVYDIDLVYMDQAWSFEIVQATGQIIHRSFEIRPMPVPMPTVPASGSPAPANPTSAPSATNIPGLEEITIQQAQQIAVDRIPGASLSNVVSAENDHDHGVAAYDIEIAYDGAKYEYRISHTGIVMKESMERPVTPGYSGTQQTEQSATETALALVPGAAAENVVDCRAESEDGVPIYDICIVYQGERWTIEIVQATGEVIEWSMELVYEPSPPPPMPSFTPGPSMTVIPETTASPSSAQPVSTPTAASIVSRDQAIAAALTCVEGATSADVVKCELDTDNGQRVWEIEIRKGGIKYEIEVGAAGQILDVDTDMNE